MEPKPTEKDGEGDKAQQTKKNMFLDLASGTTKQTRVQSLLASPDLNLLKLASPDLEKLLMAQTGLTPTPTQFVYPKLVTDEQEAYARGFVEALAHLHGGSPIQAPFGMLPGSVQTPGTSNLAEDMPATSTYSTMNPVTSTNITMSLPFSQFTASSAANTLASMGNMTYMQRRQPHSYILSGLTLPAVPTKVEDSSTANSLINFKEEPISSLADQSVPNQSISPAPTRTSMGSDSPIPSPSSAGNYDMDYGDMPVGEQEKMRVERKRARNRIAARKCRTRKLEKISRLEEKVSDLKVKNNELLQTATSLNEQVNLLKQQIMDHMKTGCQVMMPGINLNTNNVPVLAPTNNLPPSSG